MNPLVRSLLPWAIGAVVLTGGVAWYNHTQREIGRRDVLLHVADSAHVADSVRSVALADSALGSRLRADTLARRYREGQAALDATRRRSAAASAAISSTRDAAVLAIADTMQTVRQLRETLRELVASVDLFKLAVAAERVVTEKRIADAEAVIVSDSNAMALSARALVAMESRAVAAEQGNAILRKSQPSVVRKWGERAAWAAAVILAFTQGGK